MSNFITNQKDYKTLAGRLRALVAHSAELKFLVGFFYFSGWGELYETLKSRDDIVVKLLIGLEVDELLGKTIEHGNARSNMSGDEKVEEFFGSLGKALNNEQMDTEVFYGQVQFFLELIEARRLEIKKTLEPNHAKLYLFKFQGAMEAIQGGRFITGSSNLTKAGLGGQNEFNVEISDYGTDEAEGYFDKLWQSALDITADDDRRKRLIEFVKHQSQAAEVTPFEAYTMMLKTYVETQEIKQIKPQVVRLMEAAGYRPYQYQLDAVSQSLTILDVYDGVIVADVVGLGKSVIASMIAKSLGRRGLIICPPGLMGDENGSDKAGGWQKYRHDFDIKDWEVRSSGKLEEILEYVHGPGGDDIEVVIVDEAHRFRNQDTESYEMLSHICRGRKVILLTATPFNNSPADIFAMLKLFMVPGQSGITLDEDLENQFSHYNSMFKDLSHITRYHNSSNSDKCVKAKQLYEKLFEQGPVDIARVTAMSHELAGDIRAILDPVLIRRNRIDLKNDYVYRQEVTELSETADPEELFFELDRSQTNFYQKVIDQYFGEPGEFKGAIYQPFNYEKAIDERKLDEEGNRIFQQQKNLFDFMRRLLVKRFESSFGAFYESIGRFERIHEVVLAFIKKSGGRYILDRELIKKMEQFEEDAINEELEQFAAKLENDDDRHKNDKVYIIEDFQEKEAFLRNIQADKELFSEIKRMIDAFGLVDNDPKRDRLIAQLRKIFSVDETPLRKVIIFSEYMDTVRHLEPALEEAFPGQVLSIAGGGLTQGTVERINANFDASFPEDKQKDDYQILLASDKISEGFNLNRAGTIINYDIPWNPTRVIQRVGRINRIGKKVFDVLNICNFFPTEQGAGVVHSREIAAQKMFLIHNILGEDSKIFHPDEEPCAAELFKRINQNPEAIEDESLLTVIRNKLAEIEEKHPAVIESVRNFPDRIKTAKNFDADQVIVLQKKALGLFVQVIKDTASQEKQVTEYTFEQMLSLVECLPEEPRLELSSRFWDAYEQIKKYRPVHRRTHTEKSVETKAYNSLKYSAQKFSQELGELLPFVRVLIRDIREFHTLPKYTLRMLAKHDIQPNSTEAKIQAFRQAIEKLRRLFGADYLDIITKKSSCYRSKVIIAIENQNQTSTN